VRVRKRWVERFNREVGREREGGKEVGRDDRERGKVR
jgi:hypothetical protein